MSDLLAVHALGTDILHHALGLQIEGMVILLAPVAEAVDSHVYAL